MSQLWQNGERPEQTLPNNVLWPEKGAAQLRAVCKDIFICAWSEATHEGCSRPGGNRVPLSSL